MTIGNEAAREWYRRQAQFQLEYHRSAVQHAARVRRHGDIHASAMEFAARCREDFVYYSLMARTA